MNMSLSSLQPRKKIEGLFAAVSQVNNIRAFIFVNMNINLVSSVRNLSITSG